ncbi:MAG TPA: hypothetical protein VM122_00590 [Usitatibacter sp.]|nr:hypothetical protein [Usitatibacter sp.]
MQLREWMGALNRADSEESLARLVGDFVKKVRSSSDIPVDCLPAEPASGDDIRIQAAHLTRLHCGPRIAHKDHDLYQQMMVLFSLAVDRLSMLEGRGLIPPSRAALRSSAVH